MDALLKHEDDINVVDKNYWTVLHKAIIGKNQAVTNYLLRESANPFVRDKDGATLMHYFVRIASSQAIKILLLYNVDINLQDNDGWTSLHLVVPSSGLAVSIITTIGEEHLAALGGSLESIAMAKSGIMKQGCPVVLGGPFLPHIECILRDKALQMSSPVLLASDTRNRSNIHGFSILDGRPFQSCGIVMHQENDIMPTVELLDLKLYMLGIHQLQNATTATCAALYLRNLGWRISDSSIRTGLQQTHLLGRSQFLTSKEAQTLGLSGATILLDGAHTKEFAKALMDIIKMTFPESRLTVVVAMANDKDHVAFAREFLSGGNLEGVICTEANIAGGKSRTTATEWLKVWRRIEACQVDHYNVWVFALSIGEEG